MNQLAKLPAGFWFGAAAIAAVGVLAWHRYMIEHGPEPSYLDADQPPLVADAVPLLVPRARVRAYPESLRAWPDSAVGDC